MTQAIAGSELYHGVITPSMREGKLNLGPFNEVNEKMFRAYWEQAMMRNTGATFHFLVTMENPETEQAQA